jgi:peptidoglycan/LPS O-acetylase OafA/YrhL
MTRKDALPYALAAAAGAVVWLGIMAASGRREAWDSGLYWSYGMPLMFLVSGALGYAFPVRTWRWALAGFGGQAAAAFVRNPSGNLLPLGLVLFLVLSVPCMAGARIGAALRRRLDARR